MRTNLWTDRAKVGRCLQATNFFGCCLVAWTLWVLLAKSKVPLTLDILAIICLAEWNRWSNERRRSNARKARFAGPALALDDSAAEKQSRAYSTGHGSDGTIAAIVGYREDPALYQRALESYIDAESCEFVLAAVDGDEGLDQEMVRVFRQVYPEASAVVHLDMPLAESAMGFIQQRRENPAAHDNAVMGYCKGIVRRVLLEHGIEFCGVNGVTRLCVCQPPTHKKGIMFTAFVFALVISESIGVDFVWSSDSDSWLTSPDDISRTVQIMASNPLMAGASTALRVHNADHSIITRLADAIYFSKMYLLRSVPAAMAANDCQSGP